MGNHSAGIPQGTERLKILFLFHLSRELINYWIEKSKVKKMEFDESGRTSFTFPGEPIIRLKKIIKVKKIIATFHLSWACCNCLAWYGSCVGPLPRCTLCSGMSHDSFAALILPIYPESGRMQMTPPCDRHFTAIDGTHTHPIQLPPAFTTAPTRSPRWPVLYT